MEGESADNIWEVTDGLIGRLGSFDSSDKDGSNLRELADGGCWKIVRKLLLGMKPETESQRKTLNAVLTAASGQGHKEMAQLLLQKGASVHGEDQQGSTALMRAAENGYCDVVRMLLRHGADSSATDHTGRTALHLAAATRQTGAVRCLLSSGTTGINLTDKRARAALFYAAENGHVRTVRELLGRRAALGQIDEDNNTACDVAQNGELKELLCPLVLSHFDTSISSPVQHVCFSEIPHYLHAGEFYRSLAADDESVLCVPADCFHSCDRVLNLCELSRLLRTMKFWMLDRIPDGIIEYCFSKPASRWKRTVVGVLGLHSAEYRDLSATFGGYSKNALARAIRVNRPEIVRYLAAAWVGETFYNSCTDVAARLGKLESLRALHKLGVPWDEKTCAAAAAGGNLECLKYAHERGCEWDEGTTVEAVLNGHMECLEYAYDEGCMFHPSVCEKAVQGGSWDCVEFTSQFKWWVKSSLCATAASYEVRQPMFIIFDMDGTLVDERSRELISRVRETLIKLKADGHFMAVCSNNVLAQHVLERLGILNMFDFVIGKSSSTFKTMELLECWANYRYMYRVKLTRWKIHLNRMVFVDNDTENLCAIDMIFKCVRVCTSVAALKNQVSISIKPKSRGTTIGAVKTKLVAEYGIPILLPVVPSTVNLKVYINVLSKSKLNPRGTRNMRFHTTESCGALLRCSAVNNTLESECMQYGHTLCKICAYDIVMAR
eukprot:gene8286-9854_t